MDVESIIGAYVECALWASCDENGEPLDGLGLELAPEAMAEIRADVAGFVDYCDETCPGWDDIVDAAQAGHDFFLTRNGHGAGFWDRGLGELGERLSDAARSFGAQDLYVADDGLVYV